MSKVIFKNILIFVLACVFGYVFYTNFGYVWSDLYRKYFPCQNSIVYSLGSFDPKFNLSKKEFLQAMTEAEMIWEGPAGKELFSYSAETDSENLLKVNLIYDYRQEATQKIKALGLVISNTRASYDSLLAKYTALEKNYLQDKATYQSKVATFKDRQNAYTKKVDYWNSKGGAPKGVYDELSAEEKSLRAELSAIRDMESDINNEVENINALVTVINNLAHTLNINVKELNTIGESRGEEFTEGEFKNDSAGMAINVYEFSTKEKLTRVLAHELGHALGLDHVEDPEAIMYYLNANKSGKLTEADLGALRAHCKLQ